MNDSQTQKPSKWLATVGCSILAMIIYLLSYAPFLAYCGYANSFERSPRFYRAAEWIMLKSNQSGIEMFDHWNETFGVRVEGRFQLILYIMDDENAL